jgi:2-polyprenyl-6-methoxyphenol hydroxylase-like FAD-dependent oxidoreductase
LKRAEGFEVLSLTRPLFEQVVREHVLRLDRVELRDDTVVKGLHRSDSLGRQRWRVETARPDDNVDADLVIDASGRNSRLPEWLAALGVRAPKSSEIEARTGYSTRVYRDGPALPGISGIVLQTTPNCPIGGLALPVEGGRWLVVAFGRGDHRPPRDIAGFESFLHQLSEPAVADLIDRATPCSDVKVYRRNGNHRYHYEQMTDWPAGLLVVGDAFVAFNPVFGQGITVAACEAIVLRDQLAAGLGPGDARKLMGLIAATAALPWSIAVGQDVRQPTCDARQNAAQAVTNAWARELTRLAVHGNARAAEVLTGIYHLMAAPRTMLHPALLGAALRAKIVGYGPANPRPAGLDAMVHS